MTLLKFSSAFWQRSVDALQQKLNATHAELAILWQEQAKLQEAARDHEVALAKAREGFVEQATMDAEVGRLAKANEEAAAALANTKETSSWERRALVAEAQARQDREASEGIIEAQATELKQLKEATTLMCQGMIGLLGTGTEGIEELGAIECMNLVLDAYEKMTAEVQAIVQSVSPMERIPPALPAVGECLNVLPAVVEWQWRLAYWRGATQGLALGKAHFLFDWDHDEVSSRWPSETGTVDHGKVLALKAKADPFADRLLRMDDLLPYQATADAPGDSPAKQRDHLVERPFEAARKNLLTTYPVNQWIPSYRQEEAEKANEAQCSKAAGNDGSTNSKASE